MNAFSIEGLDLAKHAEAKNAAFKTNCQCGCTKFVYIGIQDGVKFDLVLYNCLECKTTLATRIEKPEQERLAA